MCYNLNNKLILVRYIMKNIFNKTNAPYLVAGTLATLASLMPAAFFVAPHVVFACCSANFFVGCIIGCAVLSTIIITELLCAVISKNNTISEKDAQLANQEKEIEGKNAETSSLEERLGEERNNRISKLENEVDELKKQLAEKEVQGSPTINITGPVKQALPTLFPARGS
ncbi:putative uncharacterized protein [Wolbachia endosymbiont of Cimex lectularius]|nr:putative uncharacterized protein [Wolbachia endosymbiont of Cimex lectularius]